MEDQTKLMAMRDEAESLLSQLKQQRQSWEPTWRDIGNHIAPYYHELNYTNTNGANVNTTNEGDTRDSEIINGTPGRALAVAVSGTFNAVCDPTEEWFGLQTADTELNKQHDVSVWLEEASKAILGEITKSNFYTVVPEYFANILAFGTAAQLCLEDYGRDSCLWFANVPIGSYYVGNDSRNRAVIFGRSTSMTAAQMVKEFGERNCSTRVRDAMTQKRTQDVFNVDHLIYPNKDYVEGQFLGKQKAFLDCYYECGEKTIPFLRMGGFDTNPAQVSRWMTRGNKAYGFGPGHNTVRSCRALQAYEYDLALAREKEINPPMIAPPGVKTEGYSLLPGYINPSTDPSGTQGLRPAYQIQFNTQHAKEAIADIKEEIRESFYNNIFLMIANDTGGKMTAREVVERAHEKRLALTPILRLTNEHLTPTIARAAEICGKRGKLPPYPDALRGQQLVVQYKSVLAAAASLEKANAVSSHVLGFIAPLSQVFPEMMDNYDPDEMARTHFKDSGGPASMLRDPKDVEELRANRAAQMQAQQKQQEAMAAAETAKSLSQADTGSKNALTDLVNQQQ